MEAASTRILLPLVGWLDHGASSFPLDPTRSAAHDPAIWRAEDNAHVIIITGKDATNADFAQMRTMAAKDSGTGRHLVLAGETARHRLLLINSPSHPDGSYLLPESPSLKTRLNALQAFRHSASLSTTASPVKKRPKTYQRYRLQLLLEVLDHLIGSAGRPATLRDLAEKIGNGADIKLRAIDWKTSSQRRQTQRLVSEARRMCSHGYRDLLYPGRPVTFQKN